MSDDKRSKLQRAAESFCNAFAKQAPLDDIMSHFSTRYEITAHEHGLASLVPFLGMTFRGADGIREYFGLLAKYLSYQDMKFKNYIVDEHANRVGVRGEARFTWTSTNQSWDEVFSYQLAFDEDGKVVSYDVWADTGAAYLASKERLKEE